MALSIAFTVVYMVGIPSYLFYLIRKAVGEVDRNLGTERLYQEIKDVRTKKAEGWEKRPSSSKTMLKKSTKKLSTRISRLQVHCILLTSEGTATTR